MNDAPYQICVGVCPDFTYGRADSPANMRVCADCMDYCVRCDSNTNCLEAADPITTEDGTTNHFLKKKDNDEHEAVLDCGNMYYGNTSTKYCESCHYSCLTCSGPNDNECLSC